MKKFLLTLFIILILAAAAYWYFVMRVVPSDTAEPDATQPGFVPINRPGSPTGGGQSTTPGQTNNNGSASSTTPGTQIKIPTLRLLSDAPVSGYGASTTGKLKTPAASSTTAIRWADRGRGNVYEALGNTLDIKTLSNTVVPKLYESLWNKNLTGFVAFGLSDSDTADDSLNGVYAELRSRNIPVIKTATSTISTSSTSTSATSSNTQPAIQYNGSSLTPYELKGKGLPENVVAYAVSPKKDRVFLLINEDGAGVGYTMNFDGSKAVKIFSTPLTQINADWPSENVIAITTKGAADSRGFLYFVDPKTGVWKKILGPLPGLSAKVSTDAKHVFLSAAGNANNIISSIYTIQTGKGEDAVIRTLADKCVWGNFYKEMVYCAVPSQPVAGTYPDDWYIGNVSFVDKIWAINSLTNEIDLVSSIVDTSDRVIDAFNLGLDEKDDFLIFMNKNDLSLWSLDLVSKN